MASFKPSLFAEEDEGDTTPILQPYYARKRATLALQRVSKRAALASKRKIWDSNDASIVAAQSAVDHWEGVYNGLRGFLVGLSDNVQRLYGAAKVGIEGLDRGVFLPVRDWILLPTIHSAEGAVTYSIQFLHSPQAKYMASHGLEFVRGVPFVGDTILAPTILKSFDVAVTAWHIVQYPIPSRDQVRDSVDSVLTSTKWVLSKTGNEVYFFVLRLDANITRTLMHTQWKVLGSGPYATLDQIHRAEIIDHLCERYLTIPAADVLRRYELAAHIRTHNAQLYYDLVLSGLLLQRGGQQTQGDEWLRINPSYREGQNLFLTNSGGDVSPLYFRLPYFNGNRPGRETPWTVLGPNEQIKLEQKFQQVHAGRVVLDSKILLSSKPQLYPTEAKWYLPSTEDVLLDQRRQAASLQPCCPSCRKPHICEPPLVQLWTDINCSDCGPNEEDMVPFAPPPIHIVLRPTLWRFYGPGDDIQRATWFLETRTRGLQPYCEEASAVLEDAYYFLKWQQNDRALLTVQVASPDGSEQQLVQFSSLTQATAIQKNLGGAISLFKRRVYRGVQQVKDGEEWVEIDPIAERSDFEGSHLAYSASKLFPASPTSTADAPVDDLDEETDHLVLIVHGIGEMMKSFDVFGIGIPNLSSIVDCCGYLRKNHAEIQEKQPSSSSMKGRVEYLPVEWHEAFAMHSQRRNAPSNQNRPGNMKDISLRTIPQMRAFANDTLMDVLYFMSPEHHDVIIEIVAYEMNRVLEKFQQLTGFSGSVSVAGHSLGSVILWDLLANQVTSSAPTRAQLLPRVDQQTVAENDDGTPELHTPATADDGRDPETEVESFIYPQLNFTTKNAFMLGSPISVFLKIRDRDHPLAEDFYLCGCRNVFNIFHPYDPVAYRIEPLLNLANADVEPRIMMHWNGGFRVQYQTKRIWKRIVDETLKTQQNMVEAVEGYMAGMGLLDAHTFEDDEYDALSDDALPIRPICGLLNQGRRIDYMLQEKEIENANEYVAALAAHSSYWMEKDLSLFIARQIVRSSMEQAIPIS